MNKNLKSNLELSLGQGNILKYPRTLFYSIIYYLARCQLKNLSLRRNPTLNLDMPGRFKTVVCQE